MLKNYILTYNAFEMADLIPQLVAFIQSNAITYQFIFPYPGCGLIKSRFDVDLIHQSIDAFFNGRPFLLTEFRSEDSHGRLDEKIWSWINDPEPQPIPYRPIGPA